MSRQLAVAAALLVLFNGIDLFSTFYALTNGFGSEGNRLAWLAWSIHPFYMVLVKALVVAGVLVYYFHYWDHENKGERVLVRISAWFWVVAFAAVCVNNLWVIHVNGGLPDIIQLISDLK